MINLQDITVKLNTNPSVEEFDNFLALHLTDLTTYFHCLTPTELRDLGFDQFYMGTFVRSDVFKSFDRTKTSSEQFNAFLFLLGATSEKLTELGVTAPTDHIITYLPDSSLKYRLQAVSKINNIEDAKNEYVSLFPSILGLLQTAENFDEENRTYQLVDLLVYYYEKAKASLLSRGYANELEQLRSLFKSADYLAQYRFLNHPTVQGIVDGVDNRIELEEPERRVLYSSDVVVEMFKTKVNRPALMDQRSQGISAVLGYDKDTILNTILDRGKADFNAGYRNLSTQDKVLLYCFYNMKKHFFTSYAVFERLWPTLDQYFSDEVYKPIFIDLGCGPLTSGLALADLIHTNTGQGATFTYVGIDISDAMLSKADELKQDNPLFNNCHYYFHKNWNDIQLESITREVGRNSPIIVNASYLFASSSLNIEDLAKFVIRLSGLYDKVQFIFQNPDRADRNEKYTAFKRLITYELVKSGTELIKYRASPKNPDISEEDVYYEILTIGH